MWHFGQDSLPGFGRDFFDISWREGIEIFHIYSKKKKDSNRYFVRCEAIQCLNISLKVIVNDELGFL